MFSARVEQFGSFWVSDGGFEEWNTKNWGDWHNLELACPLCDSTLFRDEKKGFEFLNGKDELKSIVKEKIEKIKNENRKKRVFYWRK